MRLRNLLPLWLIATNCLLFACQSTTSPDSEKAAATPPPTLPAPATRASVMRHHDALMGQMDALMDTRQRLTKQLATLDSTTEIGREQIPRLRHAIAAVSAADEAMMGWMHTYKEPDTTKLNPQQSIDFWADQARQLDRLDQQTRTAMDAAAPLR